MKELETGHIDAFFFLEREFTEGENENRLNHKDLFSYIKNKKIERVLSSVRVSRLL